jgi:hypothetical protein
MTDLERTDLERKDVIKGLAKLLKSMQADIAAIEVVLVPLVESAVRDNPNFELDALREFDTVLGERLVKEGGPIEMDGKIRERVSFLIRTEHRSDEATPAEIKRLTLRRRFLNWLERG